MECSSDESDDWCNDLIVHSTTNHTVCDSVWETNHWSEDLTRLPEYVMPSYVRQHIISRSVYPEPTGQFILRKADATIDIGLLPNFPDVLRYYQCDGGVYTCSNYYILCDNILHRYLVVCNACYDRDTIDWRILETVNSLWTIRVHCHDHNHVHCGICGFMSDTREFCETDNIFGRADGVPVCRATIVEITDNLCNTEAG